MLVFSGTGGSLKLLLLSYTLHVGNVYKYIEEETWRRKKPIAL